MRTLTHTVFVTGLFALNTHMNLCAEQNNSAAAIPTGKLAFVNSDGFGSAGKIHVMAGQHQTKTLAYMTRQLEFLPDGNRIIYSTDDIAAHGIYIYDLKQHANMPLLTNIMSAESPAWSPDGTRIAFVVWPKGRKNSQIYTANADGSEVKLLTTGDYYNWTPRWSPDGKKLVFETTRNDSAATHVPGGYPARHAPLGPRAPARDRWGHQSCGPRPGRSPAPRRLFLTAADSPRPLFPAWRCPCGWISRARVHSRSPVSSPPARPVSLAASAAAVFPAGAPQTRVRTSYSSSTPAPPPRWPSSAVRPESGQPSLRFLPRSRKCVLEIHQRQSEPHFTNRRYPGQIVRQPRMLIRVLGLKPQVLMHDHLPVIRHAHLRRINRPRQSVMGNRRRWPCCQNSIRLAQ